MPLPILGALIAAGLAGGTAWGTINQMRGKTETSGLLGLLEGNGNRESRSPGSSAYNTQVPTPDVYQNYNSSPDLSSLGLDLDYQEPSYQDYLGMLGLSPELLDQQMQTALSGNAYMGAPQDMTQDWLGQLNSVYGPQLAHARAEIPRIKKRGKNAKGEARDLYNIAEEGYEEASEETRDAGMEAAAAQADNIAGIVNAINADAAESEADYLAQIEELGLSPREDTDITARASEGASLLGREGALVNNAMAEGSNASADYLNTLGSIQDTMAAATVVDIANRVNDMIFEQQGRISQIQGQKAAQALDLMMKGRADYLAQIEMLNSANQQRMGNFLDMAQLSRGLYGDYMGYGQQGRSQALDEAQFMNGLIGGGSGGEYAPPSDLVESAQRASYGNSQIYAAIMEGAGAAGEMAVNGNIQGAIAELENRGVPRDSATQFVYGILGAYG